MNKDFLLSKFKKRDFSVNDVLLALEERIDGVSWLSIGERTTSNAAEEFNVGRLSTSVLWSEAAVKVYFTLADSTLNKNQRFNFEMLAMREIARSISRSENINVNKVLNSQVIVDWVFNRLQTYDIEKLENETFSFKSLDKEIIFELRFLKRIIKFMEIFSSLNIEWLEPDLVKRFVEVSHKLP